ncbi:MAG: hypothetical protein ACKVU4_01700 [Phycisphaerales bacterium]
MMRHIRRLARRLGVCIPLGVATTVVVAWALALWLPHRGLTRRVNAIRPAEDDRFGMIWAREFGRAGMVRREWWFDPRSAAGGTTRLPELAGEISGTAKADAAASYRWGGLRAAVVDPKRRAGAVEDARGWPCLALWCEISGGGATSVGAFSVEGGIDAQWLLGRAPSLSEFRVLPMRPIWSGLAANTAFWAGAWLVLWEAGRWGRRRVRRRRGRCVSCGYELAGSGGARAGCPECGQGR